MSSAGRFERFSINERNILFGLVRTYANVIENKKTDCSNLTAKKEAWVQIECQFNSHPDVTKRTTAQLKKCWNNEKTKRKKTLALATRQRMATGGGPFVNYPVTEPELEIALGGVVHCVDDAVDCDTIVSAEGDACVETIMPQSSEEGCISNAYCDEFTSGKSLVVSAPEEASQSIIPPTPVSGSRTRQSSRRTPTIDVGLECRISNLERSDRRARKVLAMQQAENRLRMRANKALAEAEEQRLANEQAEAARAVQHEERAVQREEQAIQWELRAEERMEELHAQQMRHAEELHKLCKKLLTEANDDVL